MDAFSDEYCRDIAKPNDYISNITNNLDFFLFMWSYLICKRQEIIIVRLANYFKAKLKKLSFVVPLLHNNIINILKNITFVVIRFCHITVGKQYCFEL